MEFICNPLQRPHLYEKTETSHSTQKYPEWCYIQLVIPVHANRVKSVYVKRVIKLVEEAREKADDD